MILTEIGTVMDVRNAAIMIAVVATVLSNGRLRLPLRSLGNEPALRPNLNSGLCSEFRCNAELS